MKEIKYYLWLFYYCYLERIISGILFYSWFFFLLVTLLNAGVVILLSIIIKCLLNVESIELDLESINDNKKN